MAIRGTVYWADLDPTIGAEQYGNRPVIIVQPNEVLGQSPTVLVVPTTTMYEDKHAAKLPCCVVLRKGDGGLKEDSIALCHQMRVLAKGRINGHALGTLSDESMAAITERIGIITGVIPMPKPEPQA